MRGARAKKIRKEAYGDHSIQVRQYAWTRGGSKINRGRRGLYLHLKKQWKESKWTHI